MSKPTPIFVFKSLDIQRGGLTKGVLMRANMLINHFDDVIFLTYDFKSRFEEIKTYLYSSGKLDKRVKVLNLFDEIQNVKKKTKHRTNVNKLEKKDFFIFKDENSEQPAYRYYKDGFYKMYKSFDQDGDLKFIDYMDRSRSRYQRDEYNKRGYLMRSRHMDIKNNKPKFDRYFDKKGNCLLSVWVTPSTGMMKRVLQFGNNPKEYGVFEDFVLEWLESKLRKIKNPVVMSDSRYYSDNMLLKIKNASKKIAILHNNHYQEPYDNTAAIKDVWKPLLNHLNSFDHVVFLTEEQRMDIANKYGDSENFDVIPYGAHSEREKKGSSFHNPYRAVTLARFVSQKKLDEAIRAFKYVVDKIPNAKYDIYGFGPLQNELKELILNLGLERNIKLKPFTNDPDQIYQSAACSILTSNYEGFGQVLTESLANGTPVVTYNSKYGPSDIIRDGKDGFLIPKGNKQELANKIIKIMSDKELRDNLSANTQEVFTRFNEKYAETQWINLIKK